MILNMQNKYKKKSNQIRIDAAGGQGFIALQDFRVVATKCFSRVCNFESDSCGWLTDGSDNSSNNSSNYFFKLVTGSHVSGRIHYDHTTHSPLGHVQYLNRTLSGNGKAYLRSPAISNLNRQCFTFWFLRNSFGINLKLFKYYTSVNVTDKQRWVEVWQNNHTHLANEWIRVQNTMDIGADEIKLVFEATASGIFFYKIVL